MDAWASGDIADKNFRFFDPTPQNIRDHPLAFGSAVFFFPLMMGLIALAWNIFYSTYVGRCCCWKNSRECKSIVFDERKKKGFKYQCYLSSMVVLSVIAVGLWVWLMVVLFLTKSNISTFTSQLQHLNDTQTTIVAHTKTGVAAAMHAQDLLALAEANSTTSASGQTDLQNSADLINDAATLMNSSRDLVDHNLGIDTAISYTNSITGTMTWASWVFVGFFLLCFAGLVAFTFGCAKTNRTGQDAMEALVLSFSFLLVFVGIAFLAVSIATADLCQDPNSFIFNAVGENETTVTFYVECRDTDISPLDNYFDTAYNDLQVVLQKDSFKQENTTEPALQELRAQLVDLQALVNVTKADLGCIIPHNALVDAENLICKNGLLDNAFWTGVLVLVAPFFLLVAFMVYPKTYIRSHGTTEEEGGGTEQTTYRTVYRQEERGSPTAPEEESNEDNTTEAGGEAPEGAGPEGAAGDDG